MGVSEGNRAVETRGEDRPVRVEPDLEFIGRLGRLGGDDLKSCMQCGTCSSTCTLSPDGAPFPGKEMAWASWGMKDRLMSDPDIWLCHQCNDCSTHCPRGARPGDVLAAVRHECVRRYAVPRFLGAWAGSLHCLPLLLGIPATLLTLALLAREPIEEMFGFSQKAGEQIVYPYSILFPHWLLNGFFLLVTILVLAAAVTGAIRFWRAIEAGSPRERKAPPAKGLAASFLAALKTVLTHEKFAVCEKTNSRRWSHRCVLFGFLALCLVSVWIITATFNPLIDDDFIYPFSFWSPWKILANVAGVAIAAGCLFMLWDRLKENDKTGGGNYGDFSLIFLLLAVVVTGFITETQHFVRLEPHRHIIYFVHLVFVLAFLISLPYSKLAHLVYRTTALTHAEYSGRDNRKTGAGNASRARENVSEIEKKKATPDSSEAGQVLLTVALVLIILFPLLYSAVCRIIPPDAGLPEVFLEKAETDRAGCVIDTEVMRFRHWEFLRKIRKEVVRYGKRGETGLFMCRDCHKSRERFCDRCHEAATVKPDCFGCHYYP
jgi:quinone-modifying oxidoreductase, subunit QmoC